MPLEQYIKCLEGKHSLNDLYSCLRQAIQPIGFHYAAFAILTPYNELSPPENLTLENNTPYIIDNFPEAWKASYDRHKYQYIDPVLLYSPQMTRAFLWDDLPTILELDQFQKQLLCQANTLGLQNGISIPIHGTNGRTYVISFAALQKQSPSASYLPHLQTCAFLFYDAYLKMTFFDETPERVPHLAARELECLMWISKGKTSLEIGMILGICESTVNGYIRSIFRKLNVTSRSMAVMKADKIGLTNKFSH